MGRIKQRNSLPDVPSLISYLSCFRIEPQAKHGILLGAVKKIPMNLYSAHKAPNSNSFSSNS